jgi:hypothetical protein
MSTNNVVLRQARYIACPAEGQAVVSNGEVKIFAGITDWKYCLNEPRRTIRFHGPSKPLTRFYPRGIGSTKTDHARKSESIESWRAALNVFADPRFPSCGRYTLSEKLADAESHSSSVDLQALSQTTRLDAEGADRRWFCI